MNRYDGNVRRAWRLWPLFFVLWCAAAGAGELAQADIARRFPPPLRVAAKLPDLPAWPITSELTPEAGPVGYVFESIDLAPIPGFEGTPMNFLVAIDHKGNFLDVELLRQHEPVFLGGLGEVPLKEFITQYAGHNIRQQFLIALNAARNRTGQAGGRSSQAVLDGVAKATASVRIVNQTVLGAALEVARAKLGFAARQARAPAQARPDAFETVHFAEMLESGMVGRLRLSNAEAEKLFAGSDGAGVDEEALARPDELFIDLYIAYLNAPAIGRAILGDAQWQATMERNFDNHHLWWIGSAGRYSIVDGNFVPGGMPARLAMSQDGLYLELRDQGLEPEAVGAPPGLNASLIFGVYQAAGLDPARPLELALTISRAKGMILPAVTHKTASLAYRPPARLFAYPPEPPPEWLLAWQGRWPELATIAAALLVLGIVLARPRRLAMNERRMAWFRLGFLAFTLGFVGWYAQGQLSIVQLTGAVKMLRAGQGLGSFLYDPVSLLLIAFALLSFVVWGRGTFCGWLCPFGALQEFVGLVAGRLGIKRRRLPARLETGLERGRYVLLAGLLLAAAVAPGLAERLVEVEPFKTAITVGFDRSWPFVAWAAGLLLLGAAYYKFFCRFVCPLGAAITFAGRLRRFDWLVRRAECGKPCQTCRARCEYDAIARDGRILYDRCFQCLDCVGVYHDDRRCAPLLFHARTGREFGRPPPG